VSNWKKQLKEAVEYAKAEAKAEKAWQKIAAEVWRGRVKKEVK